MTVRNEPAGVFRHVPVDESDKDSANGANQDHPTPSVHSKRLAGDQRPREQGDDRDYAELNDLIHGESAPAEMFRDELGEVGIDGHEFHADPYSGDESPSDDAEGCVLEGHYDCSGGIPEQGASEDHTAPEPIGGETKNHGA